MNLYSLHDEPKSLHKHKEAYETVPELIWQKYRHNYDKLTELKDILAKSPKYALEYANHIIGKPFPKGEAVIAKDEQFAFRYAHEVLKGAFPAGEKTIRKNYSQAYDVLLRKAEEKKNLK